MWLLRNSQDLGTLRTLIYALESGTGDQDARDGVLPLPFATMVDASFGPCQPEMQWRLTSAPARPRADRPDEPQGHLQGQRLDGEFLQQPEESTDRREPRCPGEEVRQDTFEYTEVF